MAHPQLENVITKIDQLMVAYPTITQYGMSMNSCIVVDLVPNFSLVRQCGLVFRRRIVSLTAHLLTIPPHNKIDRLAEIEKKTGYPKAYFFSAAAFVVTSIISLLGGMKLISDLIGFLYPAYMSFKAIESEGTQDDTQWLTYWVVFATFSILEGSVLFVLEYIPFYFVIKTVFMAWLFHPKFMGAALIYKQFK
jgi:receptor expression-enhancing protein 5/6